MLNLNPWIIAGGLAALIATGGAGYLKGYADADRSAELKSVKEQRDGLLQLWTAEQAARAADAARYAENETLLRDLQQKAEADAQNLQDGDRVCLDPADTDSLRQHFRAAR
ncbi:hypothetical protein [Microvirga arsenatis]|uniref:Uncharacterized protein n=1 Tax=Microvirga arsenatis TaxID=2692265 RepID=A0ABW9YYD4_9HYPH|nr:hypothetical protein [Microvirga arsenatis]NBJ13187.1 hypothetical protein [Microvirga arsenatis]NBJ25175.1 hypothetical protein [Microvirga arsenatis]